MAEKKYFKQDTKKMTVTIDATVTPTDAEKQIVNILAAAGYTLKIKSEKRSAKAKETYKKDTIKKAKDIDLTKLTKEQQQKYNDILKGEGEGTGFFAAKAFYKDIIKEKNSKEEK